MDWFFNLGFFQLRWGGVILKAKDQKGGGFPRQGKFKLARGPKKDMWFGVCQTSFGGDIWWTWIRQTWVVGPDCFFSPKDFGFLGIGLQLFLGLSPNCFYLKEVWPRQLWLPLNWVPKAFLGNN